MKRRWTEAEVEHVIARYGVVGSRVIGAELGCSSHTVLRQARALIAAGRMAGKPVRRWFPWTSRDANRLAAWWGMVPDQEVAAMLGRTPKACEERAKESGLTRRMNADRYTAEAVRRIFGMPDRRVVGWITAGWLRATRWAVHRRPDGDWSVTREAVADFIRDYPWAYDPARVDQATPYAVLAREAHADPWITLVEAGRMLHLGRTALVRWEARGELRGEREWGAASGPGRGTVRVRLSDARAFGARVDALALESRVRGQELRREREVARELIAAGGG